MVRRLIIIIAVVLSVTTHARAQYLDFFQSFSTFIQPPTTTRRPDLTKRPTVKQTNKRYQDTIFFETDDFIKQRQSGRTIDPFTTTAKPRKVKTTRKPTTRSYQPAERKNYEYNQINNRRVDDNNIYNSYNNENAYTTQKYYVANTIPSRDTTINPLLYRPGVRPAVVDDNRPPITNRPITNRPYRPKPDEDGAEIEIGPDEDDMTEAEKRRFIQIAEQKCEEYKSMNKKKVVALPLASVHASPGVELEVNTCAPNTAPLIIGGKVVTIREFPHMSLVGWKNIQKSGYTWKCGGSLISEQYILTAGHCTYHDKDYNVISGPPSAVQLGSSFLDGSDALVITISSVIRHPKYKVRRSYYDVALIKLETTVTFTESIRPACLGVPPPVGNRVITTGWGRTEFGGDSSQELRGVSVPIWDMNDCRAVWGTSRKLPEGPSPASQLCAGERNGGKDTCQGDSGGPAQIQDGCSWRVVAVTSVGRSCGAAETPALYAKIPRAFIAAEIFSNVKLNNNNNNQDNRYNENNNQGFNNGNNNQDAIIFNERDEVKRPGNHQSVGNDWSSDSTRPGNHQTVGNNWSNSNSGNVNRPGNHQTINRGATNNQGSNDNYRPGSQTVDRRDTRYPNSGDDGINRPGNHQTVDNNRGSQPVNYFVTSQITGNRETEFKLGNHQTVDSNRGEAANFFVTSHINDRETGVSRLGNHQTVENNRGTSAANYFVTSQTAGDRDNIGLPGNHQRLENNNRPVNQFSDSQNSESNQDAVYQGHNNNNGYNQNNNGYGVANNNGQYYNNGQNRPTQTYSNFGYQNSDSTTESVAFNNGYNGNNNNYNLNNNRGFAVANRPWWNR